jgi:ABC-type dipeptide/oligopeptide/nickel transport system ATPase component
MMQELVLSIRDLCVTFDTPLGQLEAVRGVDIDVHAGEMMGVVGESGSGKSVTSTVIVSIETRPISGADLPWNPT